MEEAMTGRRKKKRIKEKKELKRVEEKRVIRLYV